MYSVPDVDEVVAVAKELGIHLGAEEVGLYRKYLMEQLREFDNFVQARLEEPTPPMVKGRAGRHGWPPLPGTPSAYIPARSGVRSQEHDEDDVGRSVNMGLYPAYARSARQAYADLRSGSR